MSKNKHGPSEKVMFNGYSYRRYPESPRRELRVYFARSGRQRVNWLHRDIWIHHNGPIPAGFHVHHVDGNPLNNAIENLAVMPEREHHQEHWTDEKRRWARANIRHAQNAAKEWHGSPEGRAWHSAHAKRLAEQRQPVTSQCLVCSALFDALYKTAKFCSNACKARHRRDSGVDDIQHTCSRCGTPFTRNKYDRKAEFCSCSAAARHQRRKEESTR
jgi:hypothetical protein